MEKKITNSPNPILTVKTATTNKFVDLDCDTMMYIIPYCLTTARVSEVAHWN